MSDDYVAQDGRKLDCDLILCGGQYVERQRMVLADPTDPLGLGKVKRTAPLSDDYGAVVRPIMPPSAVLVPFHSADWLIGASSTPDYYAGEIGEGGLGGQYAKFTVSASATLANYATIQTKIQGDFIGLVYAIDTGTGVPGLLVDGVAGVVPALPTSNPFGRISSAPLNPRINGQIIISGLGPGPHWVEINFPCHLSEARAWRFYGLILDSLAGYRAPDTSGYIPSASNALTTGYSALQPSATTALSTRGSRVRGVFLYNTTGGAITVSFSRTAADANIFHAVSVPANLGLLVDFGMPVANNGYLYAKAATTGVNFACLEVI